jgi:hypothetical protein
MTRTRRQALRLSITAAAVAVAGVSAIAVAAPAGTTIDAKLEASRLTVEPATTLETSVECGAGQSALGGGVIQKGPVDDYLPMLASGPLDKSGVTLQTNDGDVAKQWYVATRNVSGETKRIVKAFAICTKKIEARIEMTQFTVSDSSSAYEGYAKCAQGERALAGGVVQSGPALHRVSASGPLDATGVTLETGDGDKPTQWYAAIHNPLNNPPAEYRVFAICSRDVKATIEATEIDLDTNEVGEAYAKCDSGEMALGGGIVQSGDAAWLHVMASGPLDETGSAVDTEDGEKAKQWYAAVDNVTGQDGRIVRVYAICA